MDTKALTALMNTAEDQGLLVYPEWDTFHPGVMLSLRINDQVLSNEDVEYEQECVRENAYLEAQDSREINRGRFE